MTDNESIAGLKRHVIAFGPPTTDGGRAFQENFVFLVVHVPEIHQRTGRQVAGKAGVGPVDGHRKGIAQHAPAFMDLIGEGVTGTVPVMVMTLPVVCSELRKKLSPGRITRLAWLLAQPLVDLAPTEKLEVPGS